MSNLMHLGCGSWWALWWVCMLILGINIHGLDREKKEQGINPIWRGFNNQIRYGIFTTWAIILRDGK